MAGVTGFKGTESGLRGSRASFTGAAKLIEQAAAQASARALPSIHHKFLSRSLTAKAGSPIQVAELF
jgi:hypothetical protein